MKETRQWPLLLQRDEARTIDDRRDSHQFEGSGIMIYGLLIFFESEGAFSPFDAALNRDLCGWSGSGIFGSPEDRMVIQK